MKTELLLARLNYLPTMAAALVLVIAIAQHAPAQSLTNDLVSHWPLDLVQGTRTPDVVSGYDMNLSVLTAADLVPGHASNCFNFSRARQTLLSRIHAPTDDLPINKHSALTIVLWINAVGTGQGDLRFFSEAKNGGSTDPLFNLGTHNTGANGSVDFYFRQGGIEGGGHLLTTGQPLDGTWHHLAFVQQTDGSRVFYIDGVADSFAIPPKRAGLIWDFNVTSIGGILRTSQGNWITGLIDEVAVWKRALTEAEVNDVMLNGVPRIEVVLPLAIRSFTADFPAVAQGDRVTLRWDASTNATLSISPGIGDVTGVTQFGVGSTNVVVNQNTMFTLTATRGAESLSTQVVVRAVSGVAPNWRLVENFEFFAPPPGHWVNAEGIFSVVDTGANRILGYSGGDDLAAIRLNSLTLHEGQSATLFFRTYIADTVSAIGTTIGLTERSIRFNADFDANVGPFIRIERTAGAANATVSARNGVGGAFNPMPDVIEPGKVYNVWIDVENRSFDIVGGVQNGGDRFSVHLAEEGTPTRTTLFADFVADRDGVTIDPVLGAAGTNLVFVFLSALDAGQGVNQVLFDDIYLSSNGFNSTVPVPARSFRVPIRMSNGMFDASSNFSLSWNSLPGKTYTVNVKIGLGPNDAWVPIEVGYPAGGATGDTVTYLDTGAAFQPRAFYQIVEEPQP
jgi:hypothetical protein